MAEILADSEAISLEGEVLMSNLDLDELKLKRARSRSEQGNATKARVPRIA